MQINSKEVRSLYTKFATVFLSLSMLLLSLYLKGLFNLVDFDIIQGKSNFIILLNIVLIILILYSNYFLFLNKKSEEVFFISLLYIIVFVDGLLGNYFKYANSDILFKSSFLTLFLKLLIVIMLCLKKSIIKPKILQNHKKAIIIFTIFCLILTYIDYNLNINKLINTNLTIFIHISTIIAYFCLSFKLFYYGFKDYKYINIIAAVNLLFLSLRVLFIILYMKTSNNVLIIYSHSISYVGFLFLMFGVFVDLNIQIKKNELLEEKTMLFFQIVENSKDSFIVICDKDYNIIYANNNVRNFTNKNYLEKENQKIDFSEIGISKNELLSIEKALENKGSWCESIQKNNKFLEIGIQSMNYNDKNYKILNIKNISHKFEAQKNLLKYEKLKQEEVLRNEFFANINHELKTPLNVIYSTNQLLHKNKESKNFKELYEKYENSININCQRMIKLINNMIDITKLDVGFKNPKFKNYDVVNVVEEITLSVVNYAKQKNISVIFDTTVEELIIKLDIDMIERIILNLLSNAIKFTDKNGNILVFINYNEEFVKISVKDDGIGIPVEIQKNIFERFVQGDKSLRRKNEGSGIGLSLVKSLAEICGGDIKVFSDGKNGSEFVLTLPNQKLSSNKKVLSTKDYNFHEQNIEIEFSDIYEIF